MCRSTVFLIVGLLFLSTAVFAQTNKIEISNIVSSDEEFKSCGTRLGFDRKDGAGFFFIYTGERTVLNIDGELVGLTQTSSTEKEGGATEKGDRFTVSYTAESLKVLIEYTVAGYSDNVVHYRGLMKIEKGHNKGTTRIVGWSGC